MACGLAALRVVSVGGSSECWDAAFTFWRCCGEASVALGLCWTGSFSWDSCCVFRPRDGKATEFKDYRTVRQSQLDFEGIGAPIGSHGRQRLSIRQNTSEKAYAVFLASGGTLHAYVIKSQDVTLHLSAWLLAQWLSEEPSWLARRRAIGGPDVVELCAGVGLLAVATLAAFPGCDFHVLATDISPRALAMVRRNAAKNLWPLDGRRLRTALLDATQPLPAEIAVWAMQPWGPDSLFLGADVVIAEAIDTEFASLEGRPQGFSTRTLPVIRSLLGDFGRAWTLSAVNPQVATIADHDTSVVSAPTAAPPTMSHRERTGRALASALTAADLEVEWLLDPMDVGYVPTSWLNPAPTLLLLRPRFPLRGSSSQ